MLEVAIGLFFIFLLIVVFSILQLVLESKLGEYLVGFMSFMFSIAIAWLVGAIVISAFKYI